MNEVDISGQLKALSSKVENLKEVIQNEESTKHAFILPFINILGYDSFNPTEVVPEFTADIGTKKGEKVDYAIFSEGEPILIIECKHWESELNINNSSQLFRYFHVTNTRFALLTNGIQYKFYTDLEEANKMDEKPFLEFRIDKLNDSIIKEVQKFHKSQFDVNKIVDNASSLKYVNEIKAIFNSQIDNPTEDFVKLFANQVYNKRITSSVLVEFTEICKKAFSQYINQKVNNRINAALSREEEVQKVEEIDEEPVSGVITTDEELEAYNIVLAILRRKVDKSRITHRDTKSYFGILFDNNNRKPICRLHLNGGVKYISLFDEDKNEQKEKIESVDDIYKYEQILLNVIDAYLD